MEQVHGGRQGNASGPTDGLGGCNDWSFNALDCHAHVDCPAIPDCVNILGTYCGWCKADGRGYRGTDMGPSDPKACPADEWVFDHQDCPATPGPQQVHVAMTNSSDAPGLVISWADDAEDRTSAKVFLGPAAIWPAGAKEYPASHRAFGPAEGNPNGTANYYSSRVEGLASAERYTYTVTSAKRSAGPFTVRAPEVHPGQQVSFLVFGDMGRHGGGFILRQLQREVDAAVGASNLTALIHLGDFAYDLRDNGGVNGDTFMNRIQGMRYANGTRGSFATALPYLTCVGNHEIADGSFRQYRHRFSMPRSDINDGFDMWWSADIGLVHWVSLSSETFFARPEDSGRQLSWLKADLAAANGRRSSVPWIIVGFHRPMYCSNLDGDDCTKPGSLIRAAFEDLLVKGHVDLVLGAHEHSYERMWPTSANGTRIQFNYTRPAFPVTIVTGFAGCNEDNGACLNPIGPPLGPWSAYRQSQEGTYTFSRMSVVNVTHLHWQAVVPEENNRIEDDLWIVRE